MTKVTEVCDGVSTSPLQCQRRSTAATASVPLSHLTAHLHLTRAVVGFEKNEWTNHRLDLVVRCFRFVRIPQYPSPYPASIWLVRVQRSGQSLGVCMLCPVHAVLYGQPSCPAPARLILPFLPLCSKVPSPRLRWYGPLCSFLLYLLCVYVYGQRIAQCNASVSSCAAKREVSATRDVSAMKPLRPYNVSIGNRIGSHSRGNSSRRRSRTVGI